MWGWGLTRLGTGAKAVGGEAAWLEIQGRASLETEVALAAQRLAAAVLVTAVVGTAAMVASMVVVLTLVVAAPLVAVPLPLSASGSLMLSGAALPRVTVLVLELEAVVAAVGAMVATLAAVVAVAACQSSAARVPQTLCLSKRGVKARARPPKRGPGRQRRVRRCTIQRTTRS